MEITILGEASKDGHLKRIFEKSKALFTTESPSGDFAQEIKFLEGLQSWKKRCPNISFGKNRKVALNSH